MSPTRPLIDQILALSADEPFGNIRDDAQYRNAEELRRSGRAIRISSERQLFGELAEFA